MFMLHGLLKKWQLVTYYLICGSTKGEMLVNFLMEVLDASQNAVLVVVASVTWVPTVSRPCNSWVFLKKHLSSGFMIKKLQQCLFPIIS